MLDSSYIVAILFVFIQVSVAQQYENAVLIYPRYSDVTVDAGTDLTLGCRGAEPMSWTFKDAENGPYFNTSQKNITYIYNDKAIHYKFETILTVYNVSLVNIGFYYCHGTIVNFNTSRRSNWIYVFVHDDTYLIANSFKMNTFELNRWSTIVPCRPTTQDINITLTCVDYERVQVEISVNVGNYAVVQKFQRYVVSFHPYSGFKLELASYGTLYFEYCDCVFIRNKQKSAIRLSPSMNSVFPQEHKFIEGPETVDVGGDIKLQCSYLKDPYFPYDKYLPYWELPITVNTYNEHVQVIKLKSNILLINTITMHNISTEDEGYYTCLLEYQKYFQQKSRYVYVNDNRYHSAPRIYSPAGGEIEINAGANVTLRCEGLRPVTWIEPRRHHYQIEHILNINGIYYTYLHLTNLNYFDTGLYRCLENTTQEEKSSLTSDTTYIFVKDDQNIYVLHERTVFVYAYAYTNVTVPCLPTSRDVNVSLSSMLYEIHDHKTERRIPTQTVTPVIYAYDPREGFAIQMPGPAFGYATVTCIFVTETANSTLDIGYYIGGFIEQEPFITGLDEDLVFAGQTLELSCTVLVYHNVPDDALRWTLPDNFTSSKVIEEINVIKFEELGKVLISKLILHDMKHADEGRYTCHLTSNNAKTNKSITVSDYFPPYFQESIEGPEIADVEGDIKLKCLFLLERHFPYDKYLPYWKLPLTGNTHKEHLQVIKLKLHVLLVNTITMRNISTEDEGYYTCRLEYHEYFQQKSRYVYVNDKNRYHSAPRIYSPTGNEIEINAEANLTLRCVGFRPVTWKGPRRHHYQIEHVSNPDGFYQTYLHLMNLSYFDTGLYRCLENRSNTQEENSTLTNHPFTSDTKYLFVKDDQNLYVLHERTVLVNPYANVTVPCLPTSRDVNVSLSSMLYEIHDHKTERFNSKQINPVIYAYDAREGFAIQMPGPAFGSATVTCTFVTKTANSTLVIGYYIGGFAQQEPLMTGPDEDLVFTGQTLALYCTAFVYHNVPNDVLRWTLPDNFTSSEVIGEINVIKFEELGKILISKLILHDVKHTDEGRYSCHLTSNNAKNVTTNKFINVYDQFTIRPFIQILTYNYAYIGQSLVLRCKVAVEHNVGFQMSWTTPNHTKIQNLNIEHIRGVRNTISQIIFKTDNITQENEGNYSCNVFYPINRRNYTLKHILVKRGEKPRIITSSFNDQEKIVMILEETLNLTCSAEGDPKPVITWMKDSTEVRRLDEHIGVASNNLELMVQYVQKFDDGVYTCIVENPFGRDYRAVTVQVQTVLIRTEYTLGIIFVIILCVTSALLARRAYENKKLRKELNESGFIKFRSRELKRLNQCFNMAEQTTLLSYDTKWEIPRNSIELGRNLGSGFFGLVVEATITNFFDEEPEKSVAVKMPHRHCNIIGLNSLICELNIMSHLEEHVNLINLLGACTDRIADGNLLIVIDYCEHGSLSNYLRENRCNFVNLIDPETELICFPDDNNDSLQEVVCQNSGGVNTLQLMRWALQVAHGMEFLAAKQILHGDLAVRNVLLDGNYVVKISDFGLSKTLSSSGNYKKTSQCPLPIKWMAIESIRDKTFSTQSDVWAFGVVLWELFSLARVPYSELEPDCRLYLKLESGYRLERPEYSTREIYQVMRECWSVRPSSRPTFSCLVQTLHDLLQDPNKRRSAKAESACDVLATGQTDYATAPDWIALDIILSLNKDVDGTTVI